MDTDNPFKGRTLKTAGVMGKAAFRFLEEKLVGASSPEKAATLLTESLGQLKGPLMKIGQILATVPGMLPPAYAKAFLSLTNNAPAMGPRFVKARMTAELGPDWEQHFQDFPLVPAFAASLGQVHKAVLKNGQPVAVKLQYPGMDQVIETDLGYLKLMCAAYERFGKALSTASIQQELKERLAEELDYTQEATHIAWFRHALADQLDVRVPDVIPNLSTQRLLTLSWLDGQPLQHFEKAPQKIREKMATTLFNAWWHPFYSAGIIHGDPHLGNYTFCPENHRLHLLDFGCVRRFPPRAVTGLFGLFEGLKTKNAKTLESAYMNLGFEALSPALIDTLNLWARFLFDPLLDDRVRPLANDPNGDEGRRIALDVHAKLRQMGGVRPPQTFVLLDRAAVGMGSALIRLNVQLNWHRLFRAMTTGISENIIQDTQNRICAAP